MGGRGASIKGVGKNLNKAIAVQEKKLNKLSDKINELARYAVPGYRGADKNEKTAEFYKLQNQSRAERDKLNNLLDKKAKSERKKAKTQLQLPMTYVNGYGEATKRNITSLSWEREKRRRKKAVDSFMSGRR